MAITTGRTFVSVKFNFPFLRRYVSLDVLSCVTLFELQPSFSKLLNYNLGNNLTFQHNAQKLNIFKTVKENLNDLGLVLDGKHHRAEINVTIGDSKELVQWAQN